MTKEERKEKRRQRQEARKARRADRKANRIERRAERKVRRAERNKNKKSIAGKVAEKLINVIDKEMKVIEAGEQAVGRVTQAPLGKYLLKASAETLSLVPLPGLAGMVSVVPEALGMFKSQVHLIHDLAVKHGKKDVFTKETLLFVMSETLCNNPLGLGIKKGDVIEIASADDMNLGKVAKALAGVLVGQIAKSLVCKWLPGIGTVALELWNAKTLKNMEARADVILQQTLVIADTVAEVPDLTVDAIEEQEDADMEKLKLLVSLIQKDGKVSEEEIDLLEQFLEGSDLDADEIDELESYLVDGEVPVVADAFFKDNQDEAFAILMDLYALAKADKQMHIDEMDYLFEVSDRFGMEGRELAKIIVA